MKTRILTLAGFLAAALAPVCAAANGYAECGTYDSYLLIYRTITNFEEAGKLRCGEKVEILNHADSGYTEIRTQDGKVGWVRDFDLSMEIPPPHQAFSFGMTQTGRNAWSDSPANLPANSPANRAGSQPADPAATVAPVKAPEGVLSNDDVLRLLGRRVEPNAIVDKIRHSQCDFDTSPATVLRLKQMSVSDKVILAMLEAPVVTDTEDASAPHSIKVEIKSGTPIQVELAGNVWPDGMQPGAVVGMTAAEDLVVDGVPVIVRGSAARARVIGLKVDDERGESGQVAWFMQDIVSVSGERIPVTFALKQLPGTGRAKNFDGYGYLTSDFHRGDPAIKATGKHFVATVFGDLVLRIPESADHAAFKEPAPLQLPLLTSSQIQRQENLLAPLPAPPAPPAPAAQPPTPAPAAEAPRIAAPAPPAAPTVSNAVTQIASAITAQSAVANSAAPPQSSTQPAAKP